MACGQEIDFFKFMREFGVDRGRGVGQFFCRCEQLGFNVNMARFGSAFFDSGVRFDSSDSKGHTMKNLSKMLENPFDDPKISMAELLAFSTDNIQRMLANNSSGELTTRITATQSGLDLVEQRFTDDLTKKAIRKARKMAKDNFLNALPAAMGKLAGKVAGQYGEASPEYAECLPLGRTIFSKATDDAMEAHIQTFINGVTAHVADLGAQVVTDAEAVKTGWLAVYAPSESASGAAAATQEEKKWARENLQQMLFLNLIKIMELHPREPEMLAVYMTQSLLEDHPQQEAPEPPAPPPGP